MRSRPGQVLARRRPVISRGFSEVRPQATEVVAWTVLLVVASLVFAVTTSIAPPVALAQEQDTAVGTGAGSGEPLSKQEEIAALSQDTPEAPDETQEPTPEDTSTSEPEPPGETAEAPPSETPGPPTETVEPTPDGTSEPEPTLGETPEPEDTVAPVTTEPATATALATATATATATPTATPEESSRGADWPLGTIRFGAEETGPPAEPIQVEMQEWLRLALALVIAALVAILGGRLLHRLLRWVIKRRQLEVDDTLLLRLRPLLSWWLAAIGFHIAVLWVGFENELASELFRDLAFLAYLGVATLTAWRFVDRAIDLYVDRIAAKGQAATIEKLRPLMRRWARMLILLLSALVALGRLDLGFSAPTLLVLLIFLTIILAARDTVTDIVAGFSILLDQPFRIGDCVEVQGVDTWAVVVNIGLRSSVLRTRHNVEVIVPNSTIGKGQVINYNYPDSRYRMQTHVGIAFGTDVEHARRVMIEAVRQADFVLPSEPVEALYVEIGDSDMIFRVRWWIDSHRDWERAYDCVHTALHNALDEAGIDSPYPSQSLNVEIDDQTLAEVWQVWQEQGGAGSTG